MNPNIKYPSLPRGDYPTCKTCVYSEDSLHETRYCHRHSPGSLNFNYFPELNNDECCGDGMWYVEKNTGSNDGYGFYNYVTVLEDVFTSKIWQEHRNKKDRS